MSGLSTCLVGSMACHCNLAGYTYDNDPMFNARFDPLTQRI